ncbi:Proline-serine-threonine phosphatase-interacting protein 2 [Mortierella alpina]|uniref:Proline-serine-threonine phosphatase-interacting protein 2 n=1 Tax=Mortierella alpina TaxID=64518 RepID=A0A9P6J588_MORAP|nr:Proline-serine-threonine phosphatase-interacting protein 2 [Mortierella alpina]
MNVETAAPSDAMPAPRFSQNFWGKDDAGYSALTTRMRHAKLTCQEILTMFQARAALEEDYGKKLLKLSKSPLGKDELGSLRDSLDVIRYEIEATGKSHIELASKMRDQLESALAEFNNNQKDKRKMHQASIDRTFRNKQLYLLQLIKAKEKYDAECIRSKGLSAAKMNLVGKELDKVSASIRQLSEINDKWILEWRAACDKFQLLEEQRVDYLRTTLWNYANIISSTCVADDEVCDVNHNLQSFIEAYATGDDVPDISVYLNTRDVNGIDGSAAEGHPQSNLQAQEFKTRTVSGPHQPIPGMSETSAPSSRRQSFYSTDGRSEPEMHAEAPVEMALTVGNNVFRLDSQTAALLNEADLPSAAANHHMGLPRPPPKEVGPAATNTAPQQATHSPSQEENTLGISLDVSGTVTENRFPHWQPQAPLQPHHQASGFTVSASTPQNLYQQRHEGLPHATSGGPISNIHGRSQTMPIQSEILRAVPQCAEQVHHRRSFSGNKDPTLVHHQSPNPYHGSSSMPPVVSPQEVLPPQPQMTPDGRPILFYVRAVYDYEATIPEELSFKEGDILAVLLAREDGWWEGNHLGDYCGPVRGLFPSNFTEPTQ